MHYGSIKNCDIANGVGVRVTLFVSGCTNQCDGCFQPETWDFKYGKEYTSEAEQAIIHALKPKHIRGLTILGGEPFEPENQCEIVQLILRVRNELPEKDIWCYTGFTLTDLLDGGRKHCDVTNTILKNIDILVDGKFELKKLNIRLKFRGSDNQRIIDMKKTRIAGEVVLWEE